MDKKIEFLETYEPLHSKGIETRLEERRFPIGVTCSIIGKYSIGEVPLRDDEDEISRHEDVYDFLESTKTSPWFAETIFELMTDFPQTYCDFNTTLELMDEYIELLNE